LDDEVEGIAVALNVDEFDDKREEMLVLQDFSNDPASFVLLGLV